MRLRVLTLCAGIACHSRMPVIGIEDDTLTVTLLIAAFLLAWRLSASCRRIDDIPDSTAAGTAQQFHFYGGHTSVLLLLFVCGFCWAMWMAQLQLAQRLPPQLEGVDFWLIGHVEGLVRRDAGITDEQAGSQRSQQFDLRVSYSCLRLHPQLCEGAGNSRVLAGQLVTLNDYARLPVESGQRWRLRVRVNRPHGFSNPGAYDFEAGQFQRGIMARGYVRDTAFNIRLLPAEGIAGRISEALNISRLRATLATAIEQLPGIRNNGLLTALVIGDRTAISDMQWDLFTATGTNHLVVISGLHVGFAALCAWTLVNRLSRFFPALLSRIPAQHLAAWAAIFCATAYSLLAGFSLPAQRALIMVSVLMAGRLWGRMTSPADALSLAALLVLLRDPMAVTQAGFWLSFTAVASLFLAFSGYTQAKAAANPWRMEVLWQRWVQPQWVVSVGLLLPLVLWTGQASLNAPVANLFAIPLVSLLVVPMALIGSFLLILDLSLTTDAAALLFRLADRMLDLMQWVLSVISIRSPGLWRPAAPSVMTVLLAACGCLVLLMPKGLAPRWLALPMLLPLLWPQSAARPASGQAWLQFLDVGQGLAVVVHTRNHNLLFDTGPALGPDFDAAQAVILPYLYQRHVQRLDLLIISHWHADHSGGLDSVLSNTGVAGIMTGHLPDGVSGPAARHLYDRCEAGQNWRWDDVSFRFLYPPAADADTTTIAATGNINNRSCVLLIEAGGQRALLTGDIEQAAERWLVAEYGDRLRADALQAPHHGSRSSSTEAFVQAVSAQQVILSAGYQNRFDHPHADVVVRYQQKGAQTLVTAENGAILLQIGGGEPAILSRHRQQQRRFWFNL